MDLNIIEKKIGFVFRNKNLLKEALTHRSYGNENASWKLPNNERLEFLGDAVLELAVTAFLFSRFPEKEEGELTTYRAALVNTKMLSRVAQEIDAHKSLLVSKGEERELLKRRGEAILADVIEAIIGAIYLDSGFEPANRFITDFILTHLDEVSAIGPKDPKSALQEIVQEKYRVTPRYEVMSESGPSHDRIFTVGLYCGDELKAQGKGHSKQAAEVEAAQTFLEILEITA